jgi:hypothetical protein
VKNDDSVAGLMLLDEQRTGRKLHVAGVCADCENSTRGGLRHSAKWSEKSSSQKGKPSHAEKLRTRIRFRENE